MRASKSIIYQFSHYITLYYIIFYYIILYYIILCYVISNYIILYYINPNCSILIGDFNINLQNIEVVIKTTKQVVKLIYYS